MSEPRHWSEEGATEAEKALLRAGREDGPRRGADARILATLRQSPPVTVPPAAPVPWVKVGVVAALLGGGAIVAHQLSPARPAPPSSVVARTIVSEAAPVVAVRESPMPVPQEPSSPAPRDARAQGMRRTLAPARGEPAKDHSLGEETKALDRVRQALEAREPAAAVRLLDDYRRRFPHGRLRPEATILRLTTLVRGGQQQAAKALGRQLLGDEAYEPYVPRIQSLLRESER